LGNYCDLIEAQSQSNWGLIANPLLPHKTLVIDYQQVTKSFISAIFATKGNLARKYCKIRVKKTAFSELFLEIKNRAKLFYEISNSYSQ
jgi:hypothetical protein